MYEDNEFNGYMVDETSIMNHDFNYHEVHRSKAFEECMKYFDTDKEYNRRILLAVNEADQATIMQGLASKLYSHIVSKVDTIDYGTIPASKGDITKMEKYEQINDCLNILGQILENYKQPLDYVETINIALENLIDRKDVFTKAVRLNVEMPIITYNTIALSIVGATSLLISTHIEYIKMPDDKGYNIAFDKTSKIKSKDKLLFTNLEKFNKMCSNGDLDKTMTYIMGGNTSMRKHESVESLDEDFTDVVKNVLPYGIAGAGAGGVGLLAKQGVAAGVTKLATAAALHPVLAWGTVAIIAVIALIGIIRSIIYYYYYSRVKASDYLDVQSGPLYMNAMNIQNNLSGDNEKARKEIAGKQSRIAKFLKSLSEKIKIRDKVAQQQAESEIKKDDKEKYDVKDVVDGIPDSANTALF